MEAASRLSLPRADARGRLASNSEDGIRRIDPRRRFGRIAPFRTRRPRHAHRAKGLPPATRLLKAYATSTKGPRRIVYLLVMEDGTLFLLFYRGKNDAVGANISPKNPSFTKQLDKHLALLRADIDAARFDVIGTNP